MNINLAVSSNVQVTFLQSGQVVNNSASARKTKENALTALKSEKSKRKKRLSKRKVKHKSSNGKKVRKNKMNSTKSGRVYKKKWSGSATDLNKKKNSKPNYEGVLSDYFNKTGSSGMVQKINENKRGLCQSEKFDTSGTSKAIKLTPPSTYEFLDNDIQILEQNILPLQENSEKIPEKPLTKETDENKLQINKPTIDRTEDILPDEIKEEFNNSFGDTEAEFMFCGELHSSKENDTLISHAVNSSEGPVDENILENSELYSHLLMELITDEFKKQEMLEEENLRIGKKFEKLLSDSDCEIFEKFFNLSNSARKLFVRMLGRKKSWHRVISINYKEISDNLEKEFNELHIENFVDVNIESENVKTQLQLLSKTEVLNICKKFKVSVKGKKEDCINAIIKEFEKQKSVVEILMSKNFHSRINLLKKDIKETLGMCVKLNNNTLQTFHKILLLNSFAYYNEDEEQRFNKVLLTHLWVKKYTMKFPNYDVHPTVVFQTQADFEEYKKALLLHNNCDIAMRNKDFDEFISVCFEAKQKFQQILDDNKFKNHLVNLKSFLLKFTAGTLYARILTNYCTKFQRKVNKKEVIVIVQLLLEQDLFLKKKRGDWYEILSKTLENQKGNIEAAKVLIKALNDPLISEVQSVTLKLRGYSLLKKKNSGITDIQLRDTLESLCTLSLLEPNEIEIRGLALEGHQAGQRIVYKQQSQNQTAYTTVEERAISYYKTVEYTKGYHSEGLIVQMLYFLIFYDIIYGISPEGVFQSPYQDAPLDFYSSCFYNNRKEEINSLVNDMHGWDDKKIEDKIRFSYNRNYGHVCLIKWDTEFTVDDLCEVAKCITAPKLVLIFLRFINNFREVRAGFPDLTLWSPETKKCIFVEVKSPTDKLSPAQRVWLTFLTSIGLNCQVCHVINVSSKSCT